MKRALGLFAALLMLPVLAFGQAYPVYWDGTNLSTYAGAGGTNNQTGVAIALNTPTGVTNTFNGLIKLATNAIAWEDMLSGALQIRVSGGTEASWDDALGGVAFTTSSTTNSANDYVTVTFQSPHRRKSDTDLKPHVHFWQTHANQTNMWYSTYAFTTLGGTNVVDTFVGPAVNELPYTGGAMHQLASFPDIPGAGKGISSILRIKLWRNGGSGSGTVVATDIDCHYQVDSHGSDAATSKSF